jgi:hypothetical protein
MDARVKPEHDGGEVQGRGEVRDGGEGQGGGKVGLYSMLELGP